MINWLIGIIAVLVGMFGLTATTGGEPNPTTPENPATPPPGPGDAENPGESEAAKLSRKERAQAAALNDLATKLGFENVAALETWVSGAKQAQDKGKSDLQKLQEQVQALVNERDKAKADAMRLKVAAKHGLPEVLASRLVGEDEAALEADAKVLAALKPNGQTDEKKSSPGNPAAGSTLTMDEIENMSWEQVNARWSEVKAVLEKQKK
jgi:hypothetical protein